MLSLLPIELEEEVLSRVPVTCLRKLRSTCKKWNTLTKGESFCSLKRKQRKQGTATEVVMVLDCRVSLMSVHVGDLLNPTMERIGNLRAADGLKISNILHCEGFYLLCITTTQEKTELLLWNPPLGQARWIEPSKSHHEYEKYALGYGHDEEDTKVLRFVRVRQTTPRRPIIVTQNLCEFEVYSLKSNSWKVVDDIISPDWEIPHGHGCVSLKGNIYWYAHQEISVHYSGPIPKDNPDFLLSFDFKRERLGPRLPLPFNGCVIDTVTLSSVREEQLAVLFLTYDGAVGSVIKIWITNKIEPDQVSWGNLLLACVIERVTRPPWMMQHPLSFFVDEDNKVAVVLDRIRGRSHFAYVIGDNGYLKTLDLGQAMDITSFQLLCPYLPSSLQIP
ncbi:unnamed protein product [Microthlaspi erraticum]|uniref:F-box domain-containing protein n=1 Tax=Microthlaspi erraticum TaxID=1685480 RepID=A0A6D2LMD3_9BRAS|nr:unnamed protein product [Microthlaspi erraticum]CAA7061205.1 unnamed protein product [Microthlaspi erraticum]